MKLFQSFGGEVKIASAKEMSLRSLYDERVELDDIKRLNGWKKYVNDTIEIKADKNTSHCTVEIPIDLMQFKDELLSWIRSGGYKCIELKKAKVDGGEYITQNEILFIEFNYNPKTMADAVSADKKPSEEKEMSVLFD